MELRWWAWLGVGLFVSVFSGVVGGSLHFFLWVGLLFVAVGVVKAVSVFVFSSREEQKGPSATSVISRPVHYCPRCRVVVHMSDRFCRYCGWRLR